jgi:[ribosomal protein S5]-alanine N-acetyltransferase
MHKEHNAVIENVKNTENEYVIKDRAGITIGRFYIVELSKQNQYCCLRIKFYKSTQDSYIYLYDALKLLLINIFDKMKLNKVSIISSEDINISAFIHNGFALEGLISQSEIKEKKYVNELIFGVDRDNFRSSLKEKTLSIMGKNIELKALIPGDEEELLSYYKKNKEYLKPFEPLREENFYTLNVQKKNMIDSYKQFLNGDSINFGIYKDNRLIGKVQLSGVIIGVFKSAYVGYSIDEEEQGKGYMKEAINLILKYAFEEMGLHRIEASTLTDNLKSQGVLTSCGFKKIGINEKYLFINGEWKDHYTFYKIKESYEGTHL